MPSPEWYELRDLHRQLWQWLADNPEKYKGDWPGWAGYPDVYAQQQCFACYGHTCYTCPCHWGSRSNYGAAFTCSCTSRHTVYRKYVRAAARSRFNLVRLYATRIRDAWVLSDD